MMLGIFVGIVMPDWRGVAFGSLAAIPLQVLLYEFVTRPGNAAMDYPSLTLPADLVVYALMLVAAYVMCLVIASVAYGLKRVFVQKRAA